MPGLNSPKLNMTGRFNVACLWYFDAYGFKLEIPTFLLKKKS